MPKRKSHISAAREHRRVAIDELRHMAADAALYWVLSHRARVGQFRRAVRNTPAEDALDRVLHAIRAQATPLPRPRKRTRKAAARRSRRLPLSRFLAPPLLIG